MPAPPRSLKDLFLDALGVPAAERTDWLGRECEDPQLRRQVELMLAAHDSPQSLLDTPGPPAAAEAETRSHTPASEPPGAAVGPYKLVEPIGEGGMGAVWLAQ